MNKKDFFEKYSVKSIFNFECGKCKLKSKNYLKFIKINGGLFLGDINILDYSYIRYCGICFLNSDLNELADIKHLIGYENRFLKSRCPICKKWKKEYLKLDKFIPKDVCYECLDRMFGVKYYYVILEDNQELNDEEINSILIKIYSMPDLKIKYKKDEYRNETNSIGFYLFIRTETYDDAIKFYNILNYNKLNSRVVDEENYFKLINNEK